MIKYHGQKIFDAQGSAATGNEILVGDFDHITLTLSTASSANGTIKFQGSANESAPDFSASADVDNEWVYLDVIDVADGSSIDGTSGITLSGTDDVRIVEVNTDGLAWVTATITSYTAGDWTVKTTLFKT